MSAQYRQNGATLITALIMLVVLTLLVVSAIRSSNTNLRIVGNMQAQEEAVAAAQQAIETVISSNFTANPVSSVTNIDVNHETYAVNLSTPACSGSASLNNEDLDITNPADQNCFLSDASGNVVYELDPVTGALRVPRGPSLCQAQRWDVQAQASSNGGANAIIHQGVFIRVGLNVPCT